MLMLGSYIDQAEAAGKRSGNGQVTMEFYPAKEKPNSGAAPEQVRVTVRGNQPKTERVEVMLGKMGVHVESQTEIDGKNDHVSIKIGEGDSHKADSLKRIKQQQRRDRLTGSDVGVNVGLNALTNNKFFVVNGVDQPYDLRPIGSRYASIDWKFWFRTGKKSPLYFNLGPEIAFNNYMLDNNRQFVQTDARTEIQRPADSRQLEKSKLAVTTLNLPVGFTLKFRNEKHKEVFRIGAGGFVGTRIGSHTKIKYQEDGRTHKDKDRGSYNLEDFQYGLTGTIGIRGVDFFAKYNMNDLFKAGKGPQTNVVSFGVTLANL
jgi:hypothetical protein